MAAFGDQTAQPLTGGRTSSLPATNRLHALDVGAAVVHGVEGLAHAHRIAEEEALVQRLAAAEARDRHVPRQPEQAHPVVGRAAGRAEVLADVGRPRPVESSSVGIMIIPLDEISCMISTIRW